MNIVEQIEAALKDAFLAGHEAALEAAGDSTLSDIKTETRLNHWLEEYLGETTK